MAAKIAPLAERALIRVEGPDWRPFLHNVLTHDMEELEIGQIRFAALLTPQGRLLHDLFVRAEENGATIDVAAAGRDALVKRLGLYRLRAKVSIEALDGAVFVAWDEAPQGRIWAEDPRLPGLGWRALGYEGAGADGAAAWHAHRLVLGAPDPALDGRDADYPIELDFDLLNGIDFKKGCFVGQETTSRMKRRGPVKTRAVPISYDGPPPSSGAELLAGELRAGEVRWGMENRAMAVVRLDRALGAGLTVEGRPVRLDPPPWLPLTA